MRWSVECSNGVKGEVSSLSTLWLRVGSDCEVLNIATLLRLAWLEFPALPKAALRAAYFHSASLKIKGTALMFTDLQYRVNRDQHTFHSVMSKIINFSPVIYSTKSPISTLPSTPISTLPITPISTLPSTLIVGSITCFYSVTCCWLTAFEWVNHRYDIFIRWRNQLRRLQHSIGQVPVIINRAAVCLWDYSWLRCSIQESRPKLDQINQIRVIPGRLVSYIQNDDCHPCFSMLNMTAGMYQVPQ